MAENGYTRLKARYEELQNKHAELIAKYDAMQKEQTKAKNDLAQANGCIEAYKRKCENLKADNERLSNARDGYRKTIEDYKDREDWLLRHTLGIIRFWYVKHFKL